MTQKDFEIADLKELNLGLRQKIDELTKVVRKQDRQLRELLREIRDVGKEKV